MSDGFTAPAIPVPLDRLGHRTWQQLRECTYLAEMALAAMALANPAARAALDAIARILADDWDGTTADQFMAEGPHARRPQLHD